MLIYRINKDVKPYGGKELWSYHGPNEDGLIHGHVKVSRSKFATGVREYREHEVSDAHQITDKTIVLRKRDAT
jgi:hypothetical protein